MAKKKTTMANTPEISLEQLKAQYGTVYTIHGTGRDGKPAEMYLRKPDYATRKAALLMSLKNPGDPISIGELFLVACHVGGTNFFENEDVRLEAAISAANLMEVDETFVLKKS